LPRSRRRVPGAAGGDAVQPRGQRLAAADGRGLPREDEERRLEGVVRVVGVASEAAADGEHGRAVAADELGERGVVAAGDEPAE